jgi:UDP-galactopyranose mutase
MLKFDVVIVGAGISGLTLAERFATVLNKKVLIVEKRDHIGGNCYDYKDSNGITVHKYGPHIFHTNDEEVWKYMNNFTTFNNYEHKVLSKVDGEYYEFPINRNTINKFFNKDLKNDSGVQEFLDEIREKQIINPKNSEESVLMKIGKDLYEKFFKYYTIKQWDLSPSDLDRSVMERIPVRTNTDNRYFADKFQGIPENGYTKLFEKMLSHKNITIKLNTDYFKVKDDLKCDLLVYTGPVDKFFDYKFGKLKYRSLDVIFEEYKDKNFQPVAVVNYPNEEKFTRITEYKKFLKEASEKTVISKEYPKWGGEKFYPVLDEENKKINEKYQKEVEKLKNIIFAGRLANYKYYNMDQAFENALNLFSKIKNETEKKK